MLKNVLDSSKITVDAEWYLKKRLEKGLLDYHDIEEICKQAKERIDTLELKLENMGKSSSDLKTEFMGEHSWKHNYWDDEEGCTKYDTFTVPWDLQKTIFKEMCNYVKNRKDEDYRP